MIEIATVMNDLTKGAVWGHKTNRGRVVRLRSVWATSAESGTGVGFDIWDYALKDVVAWETNATMDAGKFHEEYEYLDSHVMNAVREPGKTQHLIKQALGQLSDCFDVEMRPEGKRLLDLLQRLTRRHAVQAIEAHEWDEGCVGTGCCGDTPDDAASFIADELESGVTEDEIQGLLA
jgi:hypothetical protein